MAQDFLRHAEPIPGYRLLEPLGKGGFGEVWKCEAPGGLHKAIKLIPRAHHFDCSPDSADQEMKALSLIRTIRHPFLLSMDRIEILPDLLAIVMELADCSLYDQLLEARAAGLPGIPRYQLLTRFQETAEALDLLNLHHGLQHLDVKPRNLLLVSQHIKVADFGLVRRLPPPGDLTRPSSAVFSPLYAAPEVFQGRASPASDQYSLAVAYLELLTGELPFTGKNLRQLALRHSQSEPDLSRLSEVDRAPIRRALAKDPGQRFASCYDFVRALSFGQPLSFPSTWHDTAHMSGMTVSDRTPRPGESLDGMVPSPFFRHHAEAPASLSGYQFQHCLRRSDLHEVWLAEVEGGGQQFVQFLYGLAHIETARRQQGLYIQAAFLHPGLVPSCVVRNDPARLVLVTPRRGATLRERCRRHQADGQAGIPRDELLASLSDASHVLDELHEQHGVAHLSLNPDNVQTADNVTSIAEFGVASLLWLPAGHLLGPVNARYAAPELWTKLVHRSGDVYSLALMFQEMLTGRHPFGDAGPGTAVHGPGLGEPDLGPLSARDRAVLTRALDRSPARRFPTCTALIEALKSNLSDSTAPYAPSRAARLTDASIRLNGSTACEKARLGFDPNVGRVVSEVLRRALGNWELREHGQFRYLLRPGQQLQHHFVARLMPGIGKALLAGFARHWRVAGKVLPDKRLLYRILPRGTEAARIEGREAGLKVLVQGVSRPTLPATLFEVRVQIQPFGCSTPEGTELLREFGPLVLANVRETLDAHPERRTADRLTVGGTVPIYTSDNFNDVPIVAQARDLSRGGMGLLAPSRPTSTQVRLLLSSGSGGSSVHVPARFVRVRECPDGFELGAQFLL